VASFKRGTRPGVASVVNVGDRPTDGAAEVGVGLRDRLVERRALARNVEFEHVTELVQAG